jgi:hypothetical protein
MSTFKAVSAVLIGAVVGGPAAFLFAVLCSALGWSPDALSPTGGLGLAATLVGVAYGAVMGFAYYGVFLLCLLHRRGEPLQARARPTRRYRICTLVSG